MREDGPAAEDGRPGAPVDPDVDLHDPAQRGELHGRRWAVLVVIAVGGALGAVLRAVLTDRPDELAGFPTATVLVNVVGSLLIGVLMTVIGTRPGVHRLARPFLGVGVLGGFTTFSTYAVDAVQLVDARHAGAALATVVVTPLAAVTAAWLGATLTAAALRSRA